MGQGGHVPQYLDPGDTTMSVPHYLRSQFKSSDYICSSVPFNHEVVMVKIRSIFQLILAAFSWHFISPRHIFYFNVDKLSSSGGLRPKTPLSGLCLWTLLGASIHQMSYVPQPCRQIDTYVRPACNPALNAEHYNTAAYSPRVWFSIVQ